MLDAAGIRPDLPIVSERAQQALTTVTDADMDDHCKINDLVLLLTIFFIFAPQTAYAGNPGYPDFKAARYRLLDQALATRKDRLISSVLEI